MGLVLASIFPMTVLPDMALDMGGAHPSMPHLQGAQGEVLWIEVPVAERRVRVTGRFLGREIPFFLVRPHLYAGLLGLDMEDTPGLHTLRVTIRSPKGNTTLTYLVKIVPETYPTQRITLPKSKVDLDPQTLERVRAEQRELKAAFRTVSPHPLWEGSFIEPVSGKVTGAFGSRRIINGQPRNPHSGEDIAAPTGTPVVAMNSGIVRLTIDHFFTGKGVIVDHGVGLFSMYFHLHDVTVSPGQLVRKGEPIGTVGSTGRATGPHLHWGVRLNGARVNPYSLVRLPFDQR